MACIGFAETKKSVTAKVVVKKSSTAAIPKTAENKKVIVPNFSPRAEDVSNKLPVGFVEKMINEKVWNDDVEKSGTSINLEMQGLISAITSGQSANSIADQIIRNAESYKLKIQLIRYFEMANEIELRPYRVNKNRIAEIKSAITQKYLGAIFALINTSTITDYQPIVSRLRDLLSNNQIRIADLTPELRRQWNSEKAQMKIHQYENYGLEEKQDGQYLINGLYIDSKKTLAFDLSRSKEENLITIAHEIVHAADPDLIQKKEQLKLLYAAVLMKLKPHLPVDRAEQLIKALIQDTFFELGRMDIVESVQKTDITTVMQKLRDDRVDSLKKKMDKQPLENLMHDQDFKDFTRTLIAISVENEYKAYILSYALYQNLKSDKILPPLLSRNNFMQSEFTHAQSLPFTLSVAMNPFAKNSYMGMLNLEGTPELNEVVNQIKSIFEINYLEQSKVMIDEVSQRYANLFDIINRRSDMETEDSMPAWTKPGNFDSPTNPFQIVEAKVSTAWTIRFKINLQAFLTKIQKIQESLLGMRAGMMDLHDVTFGELKLLGMQPEMVEVNGSWVENTGQSIIDIAKTFENPECTQNFLNQLRSHDSSQIDEFVSYFNELKWSPTTREQLTSVPQREVMMNLYRLNLLKAVRWLRLEMPQAQENIMGIKTVLGKLHTGQYETNEISPARAKELSDELRSYLQAAAMSGDEFKRFESLMTAVSQMYYMALQEKWQPVAEEFYKRIRGSRRFLEDIGYESKISFADIEKNMNSDVENFRKQIRTEFQSCSNENIQFYSSRTLFNLGHYQMKVTGICYNKILYIFRQPCDYNRSASTTVPNGKPESKIFYGGRKIILEPFDTFGR
jgi:hypothetical protein